MENLNVSSEEQIPVCNIPEPMIQETSIIK
jgi:hypothetical protein